MSPQQRSTFRSCCFWSLLRTIVAAVAQELAACGAQLFMSFIYQTPYSCTVLMILPLKSGVRLTLKRLAKRHPPLCSPRNLVANNMGIEELAGAMATLRRQGGRYHHHTRYPPRPAIFIRIPCSSACEMAPQHHLTHYSVAVATGPAMKRSELPPISPCIFLYLPISPVIGATQSSSQRSKL